MDFPFISFEDLLLIILQIISRFPQLIQVFTLRLFSLQIMRKCWKSTFSTIINKKFTAFSTFVLIYFKRINIRAFHHLVLMKTLSLFIIKNEHRRILRLYVLLKIMFFLVWHGVQMTQLLPFL
jgi:hypothetical protein